MIIDDYPVYIKYTLCYSDYSILCPKNKSKSKQEAHGPNRSPENQFQSINTFAHDKISTMLIKGEKDIIFSLRIEWS